MPTGSLFAVTTSLYTALDGHSRMAYSELLGDERKETAAAFWTCANAWFTECGITVRNVLTDNGACYRSPHSPKRWATSNTAAPGPTGHRPSAKCGSTAPWPASGPTFGSTAATSNAATSSPGGYAP